MKRTCSVFLAIAMVLAIGVTGFADNLYCRNCGKSIPADSRFCQYCGTDVIRATDNSKVTPSGPKAEGKAANLAVIEKSHYITVSDNQGNDIWICDTETNLISGHPSLEYYGPSYLNNDEVNLYLFQSCQPAEVAEESVRNSIRDSAKELMNWFDDHLGGENRAFSRTGDDGGFILILHTDNTLTLERYPFYGTVFCSSVYEEVGLYWTGPFSSSEEAMEKLGESYAAVYPVETVDGEIYSMAVWCGMENEWLKRQESPFNPAYGSGFSAEPEGCISINLQNWSDYFDIAEDIEDTSLLFDGAGMYSCNLYTRLRLKDRFVSEIDASRNNAVEFTVEYKECMGLFTMNFNGAGGIISVTDPDGFSAVKKAVTAEYSYRFPEENSISEIPVQSILSGEPSGGAIGFVNRYVEVLSASGTLYFK